ncbi:hypothetical protein [Vibrio sp. 10N.261.51.F12]|uniref:hypothetical protein n=1 Tax=Vibrio sp. 10N.261.51.F12 TaxID=3229679 RepID=UPI00354CB75D
MKFGQLLLISSLLILSGCSSLTHDEAAEQRAELDTMASTAIDGFLTDEPGLKGQIDSSLAYGVANMKVTKIPFFGAGGGKGVLVIKDQEQHIYFTIQRLDFGAGWGARSFKALIILNKQDLVDDWKNGEWRFELGAEASAGTLAAEGTSQDLHPDFSLHVLSDGGASATVTARVIRASVNKDITETLSDKP